MPVDTNIFIKMYFFYKKDFTFSQVILLNKEVSGCGEMVDTLGLGPSGESCGGSSPSIRTCFICKVLL